MKRGELIRKVRQQAKSAGKDWELDRQGAEHEVWSCGETRVVIPRHREINELTAERILRDLAAELGEDWWRR